MQFPRLCAQELCQKRKRNKGLLANRPRLATAQWLRRFDSKLYQYKAKGMQHFVNWQKLEELRVLQGVLTGEVDQQALTNFLRQQAPSSLSWTTDQEQTQLTGGEHALMKLKVTGVRLHDYFHRASLDIGDAEAKAGMMTIKWVSTLFFDVAYGPWESAGWFRTLQSEAHVLSLRLQPDQVLPLKFWDRVLVDRGHQRQTREDLVGKVARERWIANLASEATMDMRSIKVKPSQWISWYRAQEAWDPVVSSRAMVISATCIDKGWIAASEDLFQGCKCNVLSAIDGPPAPKPKSKAAAVRSAKAQVESLKKRSASNMAAAAKAMCDIDVINGTRLMALGARANVKEFKRVLVELTSPEKAAASSQQWASWSWLEPLKATYVDAMDIEALGRCGFRVTFTASMLRPTPEIESELKYQMVLAGTLGDYMDKVVRNRIANQIEWAVQYPNCLARLQDPDSVEETMRDFKLDCEAWWAAKAC